MKGMLNALLAVVSLAAAAGSFYYYLQSQDNKLYLGAFVVFLLAGLALGGITGLILIHVVNRQSFHWSMDLHVPWLSLAALVSVLVAASVVTSVWSGRAAMSDDVIRAVREDW